MPTQKPSEKKSTLFEKLIAVIAYKNPKNGLLENISTMVEVLEVLKQRRHEVIRYLDEAQKEEKK